MICNLIHFPRTHNLQLYCIWCINKIVRGLSMFMLWGEKVWSFPYLLLESSQREKVDCVCTDVVEKMI